jgi:hypothetical protein
MTHLKRPIYLFQCFMPIGSHHNITSAENDERIPNSISLNKKMKD